eukprot:2160491-Amphidinium_carterae.3
MVAVKDRDMHVSRAKALTPQGLKRLSVSKRDMHVSRAKALNPQGFKTDMSTGQEPFPFWGFFCV